MAGVFESLWAIIVCSLNIGWPLFILALGLGGAAYFSDRNKVKAAGGWALAILGLLLFLLNLRG